MASLLKESQEIKNRTNVKCLVADGAGVVKTGHGIKREVLF